MTAQTPRARQPAGGGPSRRRDEILQAAARVFAADGYTSTSMREVAAAAGIQAGSLCLTASNLYRYFDSKDSMIAEILGEFSDRLLRTFKEVMQAGAPVVETLDARDFCRRTVLSGAVKGG